MSRETDKSEKRDVMLFFDLWEDSINILYQDEKKRLLACEMYRAIIRYGLYGEEPPEFTDPYVKMVWGFIFKHLQSSREKTLTRSKAGRAKKKNNPNGRRGKTAPTDEDLTG